MATQGQPCCCPECSGGTCSSGTIPSAFQVVLDGWSDVYDCNCDAVNGTYILDGATTLSDGSCRYVYAFPSGTYPWATCYASYGGGFGFQLWLTLWTTGAISVALVGASMSDALWSGTLTRPTDCGAIANMPLTSSGSPDTGHCCNVGTCTVTAIS